ncbi:MAG: hypothetical protein K2X81_08650 [Candidatus Obscuribacterales bacterium]|nr:hypothetical protein [Candidatus Obscuribacterales bacterium]
MKAKVSGQKLALGSIVAAATIAMIPLMAQASDSQAAEITSLKKQVYACHHHVRRHHHAAYVMPISRTIEKQTIIERPVVVEKVIEKQVVVEKQGDLILERPMELERKVVVEHAAHHKHLLHLGIPFISVNLF